MSSILKPPTAPRTASECHRQPALPTIDFDHFRARAMRQRSAYQHMLARRIWGAISGQKSAANNVNGSTREVR